MSSSDRSAGETARMLRRREDLVLERQFLTQKPESSQVSRRLRQLKLDLEVLEDSIRESGSWIPTQIAPKSQRHLQLRLGGRECWGLWSDKTGYWRVVVVEDHSVVPIPVAVSSVDAWRPRRPGDPPSALVVDDP